MENDVFCIRKRFPQLKKARPSQSTVVFRVYFCVIFCFYFVIFESFFSYLCAISEPKTAKNTFCCHLPPYYHRTKHPLFKGISSNVWQSGSKKLKTKFLNDF